MMIRRFELDDYPEVLDLLKHEGVEPPADIDELNGLCFVAVIGDSIAGVISAVVGSSSKAYVDYLAVHSVFHGGYLFYGLLMELERELRERGIKRFMFHVEKHNSETLGQLHKYRETYKITMLRDLHYFLKEVS